MENITPYNIYEWIALIASIIVGSSAYMFFIAEKKNQHLRTRYVIRVLLVNTIFTWIASEISNLCGYEFRSLFTFLFVKKTGTVFGNIEFSISEILGYNQRDKTLTWLGWLLVYILWVIDVKNWFNGGHCIVSISK